MTVLINEFLNNINNECLEYKSFILGMMFFNIKKFDTSYCDIEIYSSYSESKFLKLTECFVDDTLKALEKNTKLEFSRKECKKQIYLFTIIKNNGFSYDKLINVLYREIISSKLCYKNFISGVFSLRASPDLTAGLFALDLWIYNEFHYGLIFDVLMAVIPIDLIKYFNYNPRKLQKQQSSGVANRKDQLRINLWYCRDNIEIVNSYKSSIITEKNIDDCYNSGILKAKPNVSSYRDKKNNINEFIENINKFREIIFEDNNVSVSEHRKYLGLDKDGVFYRNQSIVKNIKQNLPNECSSCNDKYKLSDRSFLKKGSNKYYLEVHHIISLKNDKNNLDAMFNLTQLCTVCHTALSKNRASDVDQKKIISNILNYKYTEIDKLKYYLNVYKRDDLINNIQSRLK